MLYYGQKYAHHYDGGTWYGGIMFAPEYQRSFDGAKLARGIFGSDILYFAGSQVPTPGSTALLADNFGLAPNFTGALMISPVIQDINLHFDWFVQTKRGFYLQLDMNFTHESRNLHAQYICNSIVSSTMLFPAGYMSATQVQPLTDLKQALSLTEPFGNKQNSTTYGRFNFCNMTKNGLAGLSLDVGYDALRCPTYILGGFFRVVAPTGTAVDPQYVFEPIIGNGKGWELGMGISGRWHLWDKDAHQQLTAMLDGYITTVLPHQSLRTFDLRAGNTLLNFTCSQSCSPCAPAPVQVDFTYLQSCVSRNNSSAQGPYVSSGMGCNYDNAHNVFTRYLLLKEYTFANGAYTYANNLITAADFTTRNVRVYVPAKGDATLRVVYTNRGFDAAVGYNIFGMMRERISKVSEPNVCLFTNPASFYAVKGCQGVAYNSYMYTTATGTINPLGPTNPLSVPLINSASLSTAFAVAGCGAVDNALPIVNTNTLYNAAWDSNNNNADITSGAQVDELVLNQILPESSGINGTQLVVLPSDASPLDLCSGTAPQQIIQKVFFSLDYTWLEHTWKPYLGIMIEIEGNTTDTAVNQWGFVVRGGFAY